MSIIITAENQHYIVQLHEHDTNANITMDRCWFILNNDPSSKERFLNLDSLSNVWVYMTKLGCKYSKDVEKAALTAANKIYI